MTHSDKPPATKCGHMMKRTSLCQVWATWLLSALKTFVWQVGREKEHVMNTRQLNKWKTIKMSFNRLATFHSCHIKVLMWTGFPSSVMKVTSRRPSVCASAAFGCVKSRVSPWLHPVGPCWARSRALKWLRKIDSSSRSLFTEYRAAWFEDDLVAD